MFSKLRQVLLWMAPALAACGSAPDAGVNEAQLLRAHLELAKEGAAYLRAERGGLDLYVKGVRLKSFPVERLWGAGPGAEVVRVVSLTPAVDPPQVTIDAERAVREFDKVGSVGSKDEIVSVQNMPETFLVLFSDGSQWWITSGRWEGPGHALAKRILQYRAGFQWLRAALGPGLARLTFYRTDREVARQLFWLVREEMGVIR